MTLVRDELLPGRALPITIALAEAMVDALPAPLDALMDPYRCPATHLPWLAAHHSVDLWWDDWPEARKREMVAQCAGRSTTVPGRLADHFGTREGARRCLAFVDAELLAVEAYPQRVGSRRTSVRRMAFTPPFVANYLVRIVTHRPPAAWVLGRSRLGRVRAIASDREPIRRVLAALRAAKAPETEIRVTFADRRPVTIDDAIEIDADMLLGAWIPRTRF